MIFNLSVFFKYKFIKSLIDRITAFILLVCLLPFLFIISVLIKINLGSPIFFMQNRPGYKTKCFKLIKFRTMTTEKYKNGKLLLDYQRLSTFGKFLRSTSIDEFPELINIIKGDLSFIGPRPLLEKYLSHYNSDQIKRHNVVPGLSGWAQVNGRNSISWEDKFNLDIWYVENQSFLLDLKILLKTIFKVIMMRGINSSDKVTMEEFTGNKVDSKKK